MEQPLKVIRIVDLDAADLIGAQVDADISPDLPRRQWLYAWLLNPNIPGNYQKSVDKWIAILIIANLFTMVLEQVPAIFEPYKNWFHAFDVFSVVVFVIEYLTRFYLAPEDEEFKDKVIQLKELEKRVFILLGVVRETKKADKILSEYDEM